MSCTFGLLQFFTRSLSKLEQCQAIFFFFPLSESSDRRQLTWQSEHQLSVDCPARVCLHLFARVFHGSRTSWVVDVERFLPTHSLDNKSKKYLARGAFRVALRIGECLDVPDT